MSPKTRFLMIGLLIAGAMVAAGHARGAEPAEKLSQVEEKITAQKQAAEAADKKAAEAASALADLRGKLIAATKALQDKQDEQDNLEDRLGSLEKQMGVRMQNVRASEAKLRLLTGAFLRLARMPPALLMFGSVRVPDHVHRAILLRALLPRLRDKAARLVEEMMDLERLRRSTNEQRRLVTAARQNLEWQRANMDELVKARQGLVQKTAAEKEAIASQINTLAAEAKDLRQLLEKVNQRAMASLPKVPKEKPGAPGGLRADLRMPVAGRIVRDFGAHDDYGLASQGLTLASAPGAPIVAPQEGRVVFVGPFRGYGQIVILQHAAGAHSFLAGFGRIDAEMGQSVAAGEPLGVMPQKGAQANGLPELYFEWRLRGEPANPRASGVVR